jgi:hypothetical protein
LGVWTFAAGGGRPAIFLVLFLIGYRLYCLLYRSMRMYEVRGGILLTISLFPMPTFNLARCHVAALVVVTGKGSPISHRYSIIKFQLLLKIMKKLVFHNICSLYYSKILIKHRYKLVIECYKVPKRSNQKCCCQSHLVH